MLDKTILYVQCRIHHIHFDELYTSDKVCLWRDDWLEELGHQWTHAEQGLNTMCTIIVLLFIYMIVNFHLHDC